MEANRTYCFELCKYKKSETDPTLYRLYYSELLESFTEYTRIFSDGSKDGDKTAAAFICQSFFSSQNVYLTRRQFLRLN